MANVAEVVAYWRVAASELPILTPEEAFEVALKHHGLPNNEVQVLIGIGKIIKQGARVYGLLVMDTPVCWVKWSHETYILPFAYDQEIHYQCLL